MPQVEQGGLSASAIAGSGLATAANQLIAISLIDNYAVGYAVDSVDSNIEYLGLATTGSLTSNAVWQIKKINNASPSFVTWADGDDLFDNIFDNRESLTYN